MGDKGAGDRDAIVTRMLEDGRPRDVVEEQRALTTLEHKLLGRPPQPVRISRYLLLEPLGSGGAGVVYAAYDPELDRRVAIKLLRGDWAEGGSESSQGARLVREAQAMAKLAHPNVIAVHDVGTYDESELASAIPELETKEGDDDSTYGVFVVMELVKGESLLSWLRKRRRPWREVVHVFLQVGRGLAAAHDAGLVHRDARARSPDARQREPPRGDGPQRVGICASRQSADRGRDHHGHATLHGAGTASR
jgi:serine/threonine protein kinase